MWWLLELIVSCVTKYFVMPTANIICPLFNYAYVWMRINIDPYLGVNSGPRWKLWDTIYYEYFMVSKNHLSMLLRYHPDRSRWRPIYATTQWADLEFLYENYSYEVLQIFLIGIIALAIRFKYPRFWARHVEDPIIYYIQIFLYYRNSRIVDKTEVFVIGPVTFSTHLKWKLIRFMQHKIIWLLWNLFVPLGDPTSVQALVLILVHVLWCIEWRWGKQQRFRAWPIMTWVVLISCAGLLLRACFSRYANNVSLDYLYFYFWFNRVIYPIFSWVIAF
jgi:hypothetical protein